MFNSKDAYAGCPNASIKTKRENKIHWFMQIECGGIVLSDSALSHPYIHLYMQHTIALVYVHLSAVRGKGQTTRQCKENNYKFS